MHHSVAYVGKPAEPSPVNRSEPFLGRSMPSVKWLFDKVFAGLALLSLLPFLAVIALAIRLTSDGPVFYRHMRMGKDGRLFPCIKFRTMVPDADRRLEQVIDIDPIARSEWEERRKLDRDPRINALGHFLRRSSLDELPQFWNVLRGDMSVVGPRPITVDEAYLYSEHLAIYTAVRPGITGMWQVSGRSNTSYRERIAMDVEYITNWSLGRDMMLVLRTVRAVLAADGAR